MVIKYKNYNLTYLEYILYFKNNKASNKPYIFYTTYKSY